MSLRIVPVTFADACGFVAMWHRHHQPPVGHKFSIGVADEQDVLRGVAMVGRPVAKAYQDGLTLEVNRTATDGTPNANSMLYGTAWRAAKALGYRRLVTYTQSKTCRTCGHAEGQHVQPGAVIDGIRVSADSRICAGCSCAEYESGETGASLRAAGWRIVASRPATPGWTRPSRPRDDHGVDHIPRTLWEAS